MTGLTPGALSSCHPVHLVTAMLKRPLSLHNRLALGYGAFFTLVLTLLGIGIYLAVQNALLSQMQHELQTSADLIQQDFDASNAALSDYFDDAQFLTRTH